MYISIGPQNGPVTITMTRLLISQRWNIIVVRNISAGRSKQKKKKEKKEKQKINSNKFWSFNGNATSISGGVVIAHTPNGARLYERKLMGCTVLTSTLRVIEDRLQHREQACHCKARRCYWTPPTSWNRTVHRHPNLLCQQRQAVRTGRVNGREFNYRKLRKLGQRTTL